jgi:hypothetical protein
VGAGQGRPAVRTRAADQVSPRVLYALLRRPRASYWSSSSSSP